MTTFVVIIIDDSSAFEYTAELTPRINTLKTKKGTLFPNFYTHPVCTLSRTGFMFGSYGKKIGHIDETPLHIFPTHPYPSLASVLTAAGYATCMIGKWHGGIDPLFSGLPAPTGTNPHAYAQAPITRGYQQFRAGHAANLGDTGDYYSWTRLDSSSSTPGSYTAVTSTTYAPAAMVTEAIDWISDTGGANSATNRFLHLAMPLPHAPFHVPPSEFLAGYTGNTSTDRGKYLAMLRAADTMVGFILDSLADSANVFVWSDNGTPDSVPTPGYNADRLKRTSFKEGSNVLGVYRQNNVPEQVNTRLMHSIDIGATILNSAGIAIPAEWDGRPFGNRTDVLTERQDGVEKDRSCRTGCYLYRALTSPTGVFTEELYHTASDPGESTNVLNVTKHAAALAWLRARMAEAAI